MWVLNVSFSDHCLSFYYSFRRFPYILINLIFKCVYVFDSLISNGRSFHNLILEGINEL